LNYIVTSNHVHILFHAQDAVSLSKAMHFVQGNSARDYNQRKGREGSFWRGRYHPTMIQEGSHLSRCLFYIDMNMVRAGECKHPSGWAESGYHELLGKRQRYRIVDAEQLLKCLGHKDENNEFKEWYERTLEDYIKSNYHAREALWTESLAIGGREWLLELGKGIHGLEITAIDKSFSRTGENISLYRLTGSTRAKEAFWKKHQN
jgi:putative transposase